MDPGLSPMGARAVAVARQPIAIDRDTLRAALRTLPDESLCDMLEDALEQLPVATVRAIVSQYLDLRRLLPDREPAKKASLLADVTAFETASLAGDYYEDFDVDSKNFMEQSRGTTSWIAECRRLLDRCVAQAKTADPAEVCQAFGILFGLLDRLDEGQENIIFFADEAGAWQVGVDWDRVLPRWFKVLSETAGSEEYGQRIVGLLKDHYGQGSARMLALARRIATPQQREVFPEAEAPATLRRTPSRAPASPARAKPSTGHRRTGR
jgi:hypothetical protein